MSLATLLLLTLFPIILAALISAILWNRLERKALFLIVCVLAFFFIEDIGYQIISGILVPVLPDPIPNSLALSKQMASTSILSLALSNAVVLVVGVPFSYWLFSALRKEKPSASV